MQVAMYGDLVVQGKIFHCIYKIIKIKELIIYWKGGFVLRD